MKKIILLGIVAIAMTSCVSKKKYVELENKYNTTHGNLVRLKLENEKIQKHIDNYNKKLQSLEGINGKLQEESNSKFELVGNVTLISEDMKQKLNKTLSKLDPSLLANAKTLKDSMNVALSHNLKKRISVQDFESDDVNVSIDETVVMITIADNLLFRTASYRINEKADKVLRKLSDIIKSEPSMDVMIEGHTDSRSINTDCLADNWDLSVKRATSIVRRLEKKYGIEPERLIASGRGSSLPLFENNSKENRAKNRRTKIIILPNLDKFFGLLAEQGKLD